MQDRSAPLALPLKAFSASDAWVVEYLGTFSSGSYATEHWNGSTWTTVPLRKPFVHGKPTTFFEINAIGGTSGSDVWVVGRVISFRPLIEHFDGRSWTIVPEPTGANAGSVQLMGLSVEAPNDAWAVGFYIDPRVHNRFGRPARTYAAHWNGQAWSYVPTPNVDWPNENLDNTLAGVGGSGPNDVWAVGTVGVSQRVGELALHWNGSTWAIPEGPTRLGSGALNAVADLAPKDVWAVGTDAEFWCL